MERRDKNGLTEKEFLATYRPKDYDRPSVTADIAVFSMSREGLRVLLVRRGGHPYLGYWALPGGFAQKGESVDETAARELEEETGYHAQELIPLGLFYPACAYSDETIWMYLAKGLTRGERHLDADEFLDVELIPLKDLVAEVMAGNIPDAKTQIAILKAAVHEGVLAGRD